MSRKGAFGISHTARRKRLVFKPQAANEALADYAARVREIFADPSVSAIPYRDRTDSFLAQDCYARGIATDGSREALISRLELHDAGKTVKSDALCTRILAPPPDTSDLGHLAAPIYASGEMMLLGLPHALVKQALRRISTPELFSMLYTCRYVHEDAQAVLWERARSTWNHPGASPVALSALAYFQHCMTLYCSIAYQMSKRGFVLSGTTHDDPQDNILSTLNTYGSVEAAMADRKRTKDLETAIAAERKQALAARRERLRLCNERLEAQGYPALFQTMLNGIKASSLGKVFKLLSPEAAKTLKRIHCYISQGTTMSLADIEGQVRACSNAQVLSGIVPYMDRVSARRFNRTLNTVSMLCNAFHALPGALAFDTFTLENALSYDYVPNLVNLVVWRDNDPNPIILDWTFSAAGLPLNAAIERITGQITRFQIYNTMGTMLNIAMDDAVTRATTRLLNYEFHGCIFIRCHTL